ncbi:MAG: DUF1295 domain-containing protein [Gemmatimonadales bacterium]
MAIVESPVVAAEIGLGLAAGLFTLIWLASLVRTDASLVDRFWGAGFVVLAVGYRLSAPPAPDRAAEVARLVLLVLVAVWGLRLSGYLTWRNWGHGEDYRYRDMRQRGGRAFAWLSLVTIHWLQAAILWFVSLPLLVGLRGDRPLGPLSWVGIAFWVVGFGFEAAGDWQLARFKADPANRGRVLSTGVWRYTRHPNYFGDACVWWAFFLFAAAQGGWATMASPVLMTFLLLRVSGVAMLEKKLTESRPAYRDYIRRTSAFIPRPPRDPGPG